MRHRGTTEIVSDKKAIIDRLYLTAIGLAGITISDKNMFNVIGLLSVLEYQFRRELVTSAPYHRFIPFSAKAVRSLQYGVLV